MSLIIAALHDVARVAVFGLFLSGLSLCVELCFGRRTGVFSIITAALLYLVAGVVFVYFMLGVTDARRFRWYFLIGFAAARFVVRLPLRLAGSCKKKG